MASLTVRRGLSSNGRAPPIRIRTRSAYRWPRPLLANIGIRPRQRGGAGLRAESYAQGVSPPVSLSGLRLDSAYHSTYRARLSVLRSGAAPSRGAAPTGGRGATVARGPLAHGCTPP